MKICFICPEYPEGPHGGIGTFTQVISRNLVNEGHSVKVIGVYFKNYPAPDYENDNGVEVYRIRKGNGKFSWIFAWIKQYQIVKKWAKQKEIDIIEAPDSSGWFAFWGKLGIPKVLRAHGSTTYFNRLSNQKTNKLSFLLEKNAYKRANYFISVSKFTAEKTKQFFDLKNDYKIIYNGINIAKSPQIGREENLIAYTGTLIEKKGVIQLIEAANILSEKGVKFNLYLFGKDTFTEERGSMIEHLKRLLKDEIKDNVHFMGNVPRAELILFYSKATVAVFPSFMEAFAIAPLEAMSCGCPTIYSNQTSGAELINNNIDGILIDPNRPQEIADAILKISTDKYFATQLGENSILKMQNFSVEKMTRETIEYYNYCIHNFNKIDNE